MNSSIDKQFERWKREILQPSLQNMTEQKSSFQTPSGIDLDRVYLPHESDTEYLERLGFPGDFPFTRGIYPTMYRGQFWTMRQYAGYASAEETNRRFHYLLEQGQTGLSVAFDLPTQIGYDSDDPLAVGEVGRVGVPISSLQDMERLFKGISLDRISTSMTINAPAAILLAMYIALAKRQGIRPSELRGTIQNDILKEYIARGTYIFPPEPSMRLIIDTFRFGQEHLPLWNTISISGYHMREAGATAVQEVAFTLANATAYIDAALSAGLIIDDFAPQLTFFLACQNDFLEEIAKFRAMRRLWANIMRRRFGAQNTKSLTLRVHTQTAGSSLTAQQPENNIVRVTIQALAAVLGGTQSLHTNSMDEALGLPTEESVRIALRTQQIIANESGVINTIDPMAGSFAIEHLTDEIELQAQEYIDRIDALGGAQAAIENGFIQHEIQDSAFHAQQAIEQGEQIVVGVNKFTTKEEISITPLKVDPAIETAQKEHLQILRRSRNNQRVAALLEKLQQRSLGKDNLLPVIIECVEGDVTLGEICSSLREVWGEYQMPTFF